MKNFNQATIEGENGTRRFIQSRMEKKGISMYRLAQLTDLNRTTIARWLDGEMGISLANFLKILGALEIRPYLVPAENDENEIIRQYFN